MNIQSFRNAEILTLLFLSAFSFQFSAFSQGSLTPPGAPAPTMKSLDQIEARTPISAAPFTIINPGSYYLTKNLSVTTGGAITISADNVTLDLNGFTILSTSATASGTAVLINGNRTNISISNGHIRGGTTFSAGTFTGAGFLHGINTQNTPLNVRVSHVSVSGVALNGIYLNRGSTQVHSCTVNIAGGLGIYANTVSDSTADTCGLGAITANTALNCYGIATMGEGINATTATNCYGISDSATGATALIINNSWGSSSSGVGVSGQVVTNCLGQSFSNIGLSANNAATNSFGGSNNGAYGLQVVGTASFCAGSRFGGIALKAAIAIGCTTFGGIVDPSTAKFLGTP
jgi:hypothetical protein